MSLFAQGHVLAAGGIYLRPPERRELEVIRWLWSDPDTMRDVGGPITGFSAGEAGRWFARMVEPGSDTDAYCLVFTNDHQPVGEISFHGLDRKTMTAHFNVKIAGEQRGMVYAREAMEAFLRFYFVDLGGRAMLDDVALDNERGQRVLLAFGFEHDPSVQGVFRARLSRDRFLELYPRGTQA